MSKTADNKSNDESNELLHSLSRHFYSSSAARQAINTSYYNSSTTIIDEYNKALAALNNQFEQELVKNYSVFHQELESKEFSEDKLYRELNASLFNQFIELSANEWENYTNNELKQGIDKKFQEINNPNTILSRHSKLIASNASLLNSLLGELAALKQKNLLELRLATEKQEERERKKKASEAKLLQLTDLAVNQILPMFPHLTLDQAIAALEINFDKPDNTIDWLLNKSQQQLDDLVPNLSNIHGKAAAVLGINEADQERNTAPTSYSNAVPRLMRQYTEDRKRLTFVAVFITPSNDPTVELQLILDRNRIVINQRAVSSVTLPLSRLLSFPSFRVIANPLEKLSIQSDVECRVAHLIYERFDDSICPLALQPNISLKDYKIELNHRADGIESIAHYKDGAVMFNTAESHANNPLIQEPIVIYTQIADENTLNILHMHVHDLDDAIRIDTVCVEQQLGTDVYQFQADREGKQLNYKILAKNNSIESVLFPAGVVKHKEISIPQVNHYISLSNNRLGRVVQPTPIGLIIANSHSNYVDKFNEQHGSIDQFFIHYPAISECVHKYPADLPGYIFVEILLAEDALLSPPLRVSVPICTLQPAQQQQINRFNQLINHQQTNTIKLYSSSIQQLQEGLALLDKNDANPQQHKELLEKLNQAKGTINEIHKNSQASAELAALITANSSVVEQCFQWLARLQRVAALNRRL
jgi:hypothetical protein